MPSFSVQHYFFHNAFDNKSCSTAATYAGNDHHDVFTGSIVGGQLIAFVFQGVWGCANAISTLTEMMQLASTHLNTGHAISQHRSAMVCSMAGPRLIDRAVTPAR